MSSEDVIANEEECVAAMQCDNEVILADGKYAGPCMKSEISFGEYMGCKDIAEVMIMTDDGRVSDTNHLSLRAPCPDF